MVGSEPDQLQQAPGSAQVFSNVPDTMYYGGYPGEHDFIDVTNSDFTGCIDNVLLDERSLSLSKSKETLGTTPGCPVEVSSTLGTGMLRSSFFP